MCSRSIGGFIVKTNEDRTQDLLINSFKDVTSRLGKVESKIDEFSTVLMQHKSIFSDIVIEAINNKVPEMFRDCKATCPINNAAKEITQTNIKTKLFRESIPAKTVKKLRLNSIPRPAWYILLIIAASIAAKYGIDLSILF